MLEGKHMNGGVSMREYDNDAGACMRACEADTDCLALDFNRGDGACYFHYADSICNEIRDKADCVHYSFVKCCKCLLRIATA